MIDVPVLVKEALREGNTRKNYRFDVYNADETEVDFSIENNNLVKESVRIDERMSSDTNLKFGLCEGTQLEFQYFGITNITSRRLKAYVEVNYVNENGVDSWHPITLGWFTVKECSRQASTGILKVSCYNKLLSDYLDAKANELLLSQLGETTQTTISSMIRLLLTGYRIEEDRTGITPIAPIDPEEPFPFEEPEVIVSTAMPLYPSEYGVDTPLNSKIYTSGSSFGIFSIVNMIERESDPIYLYFKAGNFVAFERAFYSFLLNLLDSAKLKNRNGDIVAGQEILDDLSSSFALICGLSDLNQQKFYSTIQWEYEEKHGISHTSLKGTATDGLLQLQDAAIYMPYSYGLFYDLYSAIQRGSYSFDGSVGSKLMGSYKYYLDETLSESEEKTVSLFYFNSNIYETNFDVVKDYWVAYPVDETTIGNTTVDLPSLADYTLRDIQSAVFETQCQYGKLDRETDLFSGVELNNNRLLPADTLYPADDLYPNSMSERANRAMYSKLWADEGNVRSFRYLIITYKGTEIDPDTQQEREAEKKLQRTVNTNGTDDYNMSDNWLFKNLVWTDEDVGNYADVMVEKMRNITWFPFEMWCAGLPYIETGDEVEIGVGQNTYTSYVLRRILKGIQNLQDEMINGTLDIF